jgi:CRP/FNR family transcriptional regulator, anaerobic regulatory protein
MLREEYLSVIWDMDEFRILKDYVSRFLSFTDEEWQLHQSVLTRRFLKKGEFLLKGGEVCDHVTFLNKGHFRVYNIVGGDELTINFAFEGNYVTDYTSFVSRQPSSDYILAMDDAEVLQIKYEDLQATYDKAPVWQKFGRMMAEYILVFISERNKALLFNTPEERYIKLMKERPKVIERIPQQYIASYLGIKPESLSRIRKRMMEAKKTYSRNAC